MGFLRKDGFECKACGTSFRSEGELAAHGKIHTGTQEDHLQHEHFSCSACGTTFHSSNELAVHAELQHTMT